ncbi:MAG: hypothetical protein IH840_11520 [Candidatus Heimdallarchaeota archaeon]|nr:hypothetical protein [Candidatus Heimdallarchaeota archaeon]
MNEEIEPRTTVTPIKKASKFQRERKSTKVIDENDPRFKKYDVELNGRSVQISYDKTTDEVVIDGKLYNFHVTEVDGYFIAAMGDHTYTIEHHDGQIFLEGRLIEFNFKASAPKLVRKKIKSGDEEIIGAPLPGQVVGFSVKVGDKVTSGQKILTLEAMKMQNEINCVITGIVEEIYVREGDLVKTNDKLVRIVVEKE